MKTYIGIRQEDGALSVTVNAKPLNPRLDLCNHSPTGFECGYSGSGPAQLALALPLPSGQDRLAGLVGGVGPAIGLWVTGGVDVGVVPPPQPPIESVTRAATAHTTRARRRSIMKPP